MIEVVLGLVVVGFLAVLVYGLATRRIDWRQETCCAPADPANDLRMRESTPTDTTTGTSTTPGTSRRAEP